MTFFGCCFGFTDDAMESSKNQRLGFFANLFYKITALLRNPETETSDTEEVMPNSVESEFDPDYDNVCPSCFEEYTAENSKVTTKRDHHYHLGCIYEWMERSPICPFCTREMELEECLPVSLNCKYTGTYE